MNIAVSAGQSNTDGPISGGNGAEGASRTDRHAEASAVDYAVDLVALSKAFQRQTRQRKGYTTIKSALLRPFMRGPACDAQVTHAIRDLTLRIPRGSSVGLIGRNGSGKSTFLKLVTGIYKPTSGKVRVNGRVAALIELGAGFHPDFTGRENLMLGGVMHGLTRREIEERFDEIVEFAELTAVIDDPVRTYSSGMFMRLGFSLAIHTDPDILLIDEVLAVGDAAFVAKCKDRIAALRKNGKTLVLVTHDLDAVERWCDEVLWLHEGEVRDRGYPRRVIDHYREFLEKGEEADLQQHRQKLEELEALPSTETPETEEAVAEQESARWGSREVEITGVRMLNSAGEEHLVFHPNDAVDVEFDYLVREAANDVVFGIGINRNDGLSVFGTNTHIGRVEVPQLSSTGKVVFRIERLGLLDGQYLLDLAAHREDGYPFDYLKGAVTFSVRSNERHIGVVAPAHRWIFK